MLAQASPVVDSWFALVASTIGTTTLVLLGVWKLFVPRRDYERDQAVQSDRCRRCEASAGAAVTKESLVLELRPILQEQDHRKRTVDLLGRSVARMDRKLTAILVHMHIDVREFEGPGDPDPDPE
jgi:hypothetical protein